MNYIIYLITFHEKKIKRYKNFTREIFRTPNVYYINFLTEKKVAFKLHYLINADSLAVSQTVVFLQFSQISFDNEFNYRNVLKFVSAETVVFL